MRLLKLVLSTREDHPTVQSDGLVWKLDVRAVNWPAVRRAPQDFCNQQEFSTTARRPPERLPCLDVIEHRVGDLRDQVRGDLGGVDLLQVALNLTDHQPAGLERDHLLINDDGH